MAFSFFLSVKKGYFNKVMPKYTRFSSSTLHTWTGKHWKEETIKKWSRWHHTEAHFGAKLLPEVTPGCLVLMQPWQGSCHWAVRTLSVVRRGETASQQGEMSTYLKSWLLSARVCAVQIFDSGDKSFIYWKKCFVAEDAGTKAKQVLWMINVMPQSEHRVQDQGVSLQDSIWQPRWQLEILHSSWINIYIQPPE